MASKKGANSKTSGIRRPNHLRGAVDGVPFSSSNQPTGKAKSEGKRKARLLKDILELSFVGPPRGKLKQTAADYLGIPVEEMTVEYLMHFAQIRKAIKDGNTFAYMAVLDRAQGKPKQSTDVTTNGKDINSTPLPPDQYKEILNLLNGPGAGK